MALAVVGSFIRSFIHSPNVTGHIRVLEENTSSRSARQSHTDVQVMLCSGAIRTQPFSYVGNTDDQSLKQYVPKVMDIFFLF